MVSISTQGSLFLIISTSTVLTIYFIFKFKDITVTNYATQRPVPRETTRLTTYVSSINVTSAPRYSKYKKEEDLKSVIQFARELNKKGKCLILAVFNNGYIPLAHSWLCNTIYMGIHDQVLLVVSDTKSRDDLLRHWPKIKVVVTPSKDGVLGNHNFGKLGYAKLTLWRNEVLFEVLKSKIEVLLCEMDALWVKNPIPEIKKQMASFHLSITSKNPVEYAFGFMYIKPTKLVLKLWETFSQVFRKALQRYRKRKDLERAYVYDQALLSQLMRSKFANVTVNKLSAEKYPDGHWYFKHRKDKNRDFKKALIINNNYIVGNRRKIERAKQYQHWFWNETEKQCDLKLVNETVKYL